MTLSRALPTLAATEALAAAVARAARAGDAILLEGPLGAGKTAFARAFLRAAAADPTLEVPSPSFTLVQSYATGLGMVHHFDLWRLDGPAALAELGWDDALTDIVLVEWPDRLGPLRPADALSIALVPTDAPVAVDTPVAAGGDTARTALLSGWPDRLGALA
jgi:tRNA threonylcarbamoyladenosine biosynthesis protein TsaE